MILRVFGTSVVTDEYDANLKKNALSFNYVYSISNRYSQLMYCSGEIKLLLIL